jgi:NADPH:quinone reductase-like Zn-dependent oxidoreductase
MLTPSAKILVTASSRKVDRVRALGVDFVIDYQKNNFSEEVKQITGGRGVDVILDHIGAAYLAVNMKSLAVEGTLVVIGVTGGNLSELNLATMMVKRQRLIGSVLRPRPVSEKTRIISDFSRVVMPLIESRQIVPLIHQVFPLEKATSAHRMMEASSHFGKIVLSVT